MGNLSDKLKAAKSTFESKVGKLKASAATLASIHKDTVFSGLEQAADNCEMLLQKCAAAGAAADQMAVQKAEAAVKAFAAKVADCEKSVKNAVAKADSKIVEPEIQALLKQVKAMSTDLANQVAKAKAAAGNQAAQAKNAAQNQAAQTIKAVGQAIGSAKNALKKS
jgi:phage-related protein